MSWDAIKKARGLLSREQGTIIKDWGGRIPIALVYPNSYYAGMSNLGVHTLYQLLNSYPDVVCERVFWEKENSTGGQPAISLESQRPLSDFAVIAFSISYELDYLSVVPILSTSGIPPYATERDERHPLVIAGGPCITANPAPLSPFFDCFGIGEAEAILPALYPVLADGIGGRRHDLLQALASVPGIYVPSLPPETPVARQWAEHLDEHPVASVIITSDTELGNLYLMEVERGCNWGCRFCLVCQAFRPMRYHPLEQLLAQAETGLKYRKRLGLVGPAVTDHPQIEELVTKLRQMNAGLSISSLRIKPFSVTVLSEVVKGGARTITLAPEAGSQRLRRIIKKGISEQDILEVIEEVAEQGIKQLKLYFIIGLPTETDEDIEAIINLVLAVKSIIDKKQGGTRIALNVAPFVPKAGTPFQWLPMPPLPTLNHRLSRLKNTLMPRGIKVKSESPAWSEVQTVLSRGDARVADILVNTKQASLSAWRKAAGECQLDIDFYAHQRWSLSQKLPWDMIDSGIPRHQLELELSKALP